jgi:hypothetical protein
LPHRLFDIQCDEVVRFFDSKFRDALSNKVSSEIQDDASMVQEAYMRAVKYVKMAMHDQMKEDSLFGKGGRLWSGARQGCGWGVCHTLAGDPHHSALPPAAPEPPTPHSRKMVNSSYLFDHADKHCDIVEGACGIRNSG